MVAFKGHFDGRFIIPSSPISLPQGRELLFQVAPNLPEGVSGKTLLDLIDSMGLEQDTAGQIADAIERDCERIDGEW
jgi:hypothetical protein